MKRKEWAECDDPRVMLKAVEASDERKTRLFIASCCREEPESTPRPSAREALALAEEFADSGRPYHKHNPLVQAHARHKEEVMDSRGYPLHPEWMVIRATQYDSAFANPIQNWVRVDDWNWPKGVSETIRLRATTLLKDHFGDDPLSPTPDLSAYLTPDVTRTAEAVYAHRLMDFSLDPVGLLAVADALEEAGCDDPDVLKNLRSPGGKKYRGLWGLDVVLGKIKTPNHGRPQC